MHSINEHSPFEIIYDFNPFTPINLLPLPIFERTSLDGKRKVKMVKLHESVHERIEKKNKDYAFKSNKGWQRVIFESNNWVWVDIRKERFLKKR